MFVFIYCVSRYLHNMLTAKTYSFGFTHVVWDHNQKSFRFGISGHIDTSGRFTKEFAVKAIFGAFLAMLQDENLQVNGIMYIFDMTGYEMRHMRYFTIEDNKKLVKLWQVCPLHRYLKYCFWMTFSKMCINAFNIT